MRCRCACGKNSDKRTIVDRANFGQGNVPEGAERTGHRKLRGWIARECVLCSSKVRPKGPSHCTLVQERRMSGQPTRSAFSSQYEVFCVERLRGCRRSKRREISWCSTPARIGFGNMSVPPTGYSSRQIRRVRGRRLQRVDWQNIRTCPIVTVSERARMSRC
jgi:hypothetical protein